MGQQELEQAFELIAEHADEADFVGVRPESLISDAERALGVEFPPTYRSFVRRFGAGDLFGEEIYGVIDGDFDRPAVPNGTWITHKRREESGLPEGMIVVAALGEGSDVVLDTAARGQDGEAPVLVWTPGASSPDDDLEVLAADFGEWLLQVLREAA